jgi:N-acetylglutamate synthase-like GNAT family acetyltransferase
MKSLTLTFRKAQLSDASQVEALINSAYRGDSARIGWTYESDLVDGARITLSELEAIISSSGEYYILVFSEEGLSGCVHLSESGEVLEIGMLTVRPDLQARKIGSSLFLEIERLAKVKGFKQLKLSVIHLRKELIAYYERKGFVLTGESGPFPEKYPAKLPGLMLLGMRKTL